MKRLGLGAALVALSLAMSVPSVAEAQTNPGAIKLFQEGRALLEKKQYGEAIEKFKASHAMDPSVGALLNLGDAYKELGKFASAWSAYTNATSLAKARNDNRAAEGEQRARALEPRLPKLTVHVTARHVDIAVTDNGMALPAASFETALPVDPGPHAVVATAKGKKAFRANVELAESQSRDVTIPALEDDPNAITSSSAPHKDDTHGDGQRTLGTGFLIGGGIVTVAGLAFGAVALSKWGTVKDTCPDKHCPTEADRARLDDDAKSASTFATVSTIGVIVGVIAAGAGLALHLTAPSKTAASPVGGGPPNPLISPSARGFDAAIRF